MTETRNNLNRLITSSETEFVVKTIPSKKKKHPGPDGFTYKEVLISSLLKLFQKTEEDRTLPNLFYEATITLIQKAGKDTTKKKIIGQYL